VRRPPTPRARRLPARAVLMALVGALVATLVPIPTPAAAQLDPSGPEDTAPPSVPVEPDTSFVEVSRGQISLGIEHVRYQRSEPLALAHVARIRPEARHRLRVVAARDEVSGRRETVTSMCARHSCSVAINGDYWDGASFPTGVVVADGELMQSPPLWHAQFVIQADGTPTSEPLPWSVTFHLGSEAPITVDAVNRDIAEGQLVLYTRRRGSTTRTPEGTREIVLQVLAANPDGSMNVRVLDQRTTGNLAIEENRVILAGRGSAEAVLSQIGTLAAQGTHTGVIRVDIGGARHALGGSPRLMVDGRYAFPHTDPAANSRAPRSAVGWTASGEMLLVAVDGRQNGHSNGVSYTELARLLAQLGAIEGIALDGGGSTTFVVESSVVNRPSDGSQRSVVNAIVVDPVQLRSNRVSGPNRYATAVAASQQTFPNGADFVVIASGQNYPDALAGAAATRGRAPVLLVERDRVPAEVVAEIDRLRPGAVVILGGTAAVSQDVANQLYARVPFTVRFSGSDRVGTAIAASQWAFPEGAPVVYLATADTFPDALSAGSGATAEGGPVLLVRGSSLDPAVATELRRLSPQRIVVIGGTAAVAPAIADQAAAIAPVTRVSGANRYATAAEVARAVHPSATDAVVATGLDFPDALSGAWLAGTRRQPLLLVPGTCAAEPAVRAADRLGVSGVTIMGGTAAVHPRVERLAVCAP
jgi:putative cell wall-binding protein/exopolysaccharide biosynthesis protein